MANMMKIGRTATTVVETDGNVQVKYHSTIVFERRGAQITVRHGGWVTPTTCRRINQAFSVYRVSAHARILKGELLIERFDGRPELTVPNGPLTWDA